MKKIRVKTKMTMNNTLKSEVVVVMVPLPAQGHLNQLLHLSHLIAAYGIPVHYAGCASHNRQVKVRCNGWESESLTKIQFHDFELPPYDSPPPNVDLISFPHHLLPLFKASMHLRQPVSVLLQQLSGKFNRVIVIHDLVMAYVVQDVKLIPNGETYSFNPVSAFYNFLYSWISIPDKEKPFQLDSKDIPEGIPPEDDGFSTQDMTEFFLNQMKFLGFESGWIFNTSRIIEGRYVQLLERLPTTKSQRNYFALGPFNPVKIKSESMKNRHQCLNWLDKQGKDSVIYVSFGSTISLTDDQITELANGLERCGEKFIWVLRRADPNDIFTEADKVKKPQLHADYEERVKDRGIIVRDWAPQLEILAHPSVGGFMSHCGWNSCMESISMGVPVVAWPMHSDQPKNAFLVSNVLKIGVMVREWEHRGEIVKSITIENAVKTLMASQEGKEIKMRAANIGEAVRGSVAEGGASNLERDAFISHISR